MNDWGYGDTRVLWYGERSMAALPRRCMIALPELSPAQWGRWAETGYEQHVSSLHARGVAVPGHPASCLTAGCHHSIVWHYRCRYACNAEGCACRSLRRAPVPGAARP